MRSVLSVLAGSAAWTLFWLATSRWVTARFGRRFHDDGSIDDPALLLFLVSASLVFSLVAGWLVAWLVKRDELVHGLGLGLWLLALGLFFQIQSWEFAPLWYHALFLALLVPGAAAGAWWRELQGRDIRPAID